MFARIGIYDLEPRAKPGQFKIQPRLFGQRLVEHGCNCKAERRGLDDLVIAQLALVGYSAKQGP